MSDTVTIDMGEDSEPIITTTDAETRFACEICGVPLTYSGRGRHPTRCDEHKRGSTAKAKTSPGTANIRAGMTSLYEMAGGGFTILGTMTDNVALRNDGEIVTSRADAMGELWADLAAKDPQVRKALTKLTTGGSAGSVVIAHAMLAVAIIVNHRENPGPPRAPRAPRVRPERAPREPRRRERAPRPDDYVRPPVRLVADDVMPDIGDVPVGPDVLVESDSRSVRP